MADERDVGSDEWCREFRRRLNNRLVICYPMPTPQYGRSDRGFTVIELMIAVALAVILAAVALPSFLDSVRKSRRADAFIAITTVQQAQERWRGSRSAYADALPNTAVAPEVNGLGLGAQSASGYYDLALSNVATSGYTVTATAASGKSQDQDGACKILGVRIRDGNVVYGAGAADINWAAANPDAGRCWAR